MDVNNTLTAFLIFNFFIYILTHQAGALRLTSGLRGGGAILPPYDLSYFDPVRIVNLLYEIWFITHAL